MESLIEKKLRFKRWDAKNRGLAFELTEEQINILLNDVGITLEDWSFDGYHLSRHNDEGDYIFGNCTFKPAKQNMAEQKHICQRPFSEKDRIRGCEASLTEEARKKRKDTFKKIRHQQGKRNNQYGTFWITNGIQNMKWKPEKGELPNGFHKGRI